MGQEQRGGVGGDLELGGGPGKEGADDRTFYADKFLL